MSDFSITANTTGFAELVYVHSRTKHWWLCGFPTIAIGC